VAADREHVGAGALPHLGFGDGLPVEIAPLLHRALLEHEFELAGVHDDIEEVGDGWMEQQSSDATTADGVRREHVRRAGAEQLGLGRGLVGPRDDDQLRVQRPRRERDEQIRGVVTRDRDEPGGARDPGLLEHVIVGAVPDDSQDAGRRVIRYLLRSFDDHARTPLVHEVQHDLLSHAAEAADDVVPAQGVDALLHTRLP
jgi:hypothetical protein